MIFIGIELQLEHLNGQIISHVLCLYRHLGSSKTQYYLETLSMCKSVVVAFFTVLTIPKFIIKSLIYALN